jgi:hypothetical protein
MKKLLSIILALQVFFIIAGFSMEITEVFTAKGKFFESESKFIEFYNNSTNSFDVTQISLIIYTNKNSYVKIKLEKGGINTDIPDLKSFSTIIFPFDTCVVISRKYTNTSELLPFSSNCMILHPESETLWNDSWQNKLYKIEIHINEKLDFSTPELHFEYPDDLPYSFSIGSNKVIRSGLSPGNPSLSHIFSSNLIVRSGENVRFIAKQNNVEEKINIRTTKTFYRDEIVLTKSGDYYIGKWTVPYGLKNGENIILESREARLILRYIDFHENSIFYNKIFINELVGDPVIDYSGGNWTGMDGGGTINSTDDWVELLNISQESINLSNFYFLERTKNGENIKKFTTRKNTTMERNEKFFLSNGFIIVTPENGIAENGLLYLFDGHPYKGGKVVDSVEYGKDFDGDGIFLSSLKSTSIDDEALARVIQGTSHLEKKRIFKKTKATFAMENSPEKGILIYNFTNNLLEIFVADKSISNEILTLSLINSIDREVLSCFKTNFYFYGNLLVKENDTTQLNKTLGVKNGITTLICYTNNYEMVSENFTYLKDGWEISTTSTNLSKVVIFPNPLQGGKSLKIANLPVETEIYCINEKGYIIRKEVAKKDFIVWEENFQKGIYTIVFRYNGEKVSKKLIVY